MNMTRTATLASLLSILIAGTGCIAPLQRVPAAPDQDAAAPAVQTTTQKETKSELDQTIDRAAAEAKTTLHTSKVKHQDLFIEATPMWSFDYQGAVHIRIHGADGQLLRDEFRK